MIKLEKADNIDWIVKKIDSQKSGRAWKGNFVSHLLPDRFDRYIKILHTIYEDESITDKQITWNQTEQENISEMTDDPVKSLLTDSTMTFSGIGENFKGKRVKWIDLSQRYDVPYKKTININSFINRLPENSFPRYLVGPNEGSFEKHEILELIKILSPSCTKKDCYFYYDQLVFGDFDKEYFYKGKISELIDLYNHQDLPFENSPTYIWSETKDWCVNSDYDLCFTIIGCDSEIAERLLSSDILESIEVDRKTRIDYKADEK